MAINAEALRSLKQINVSSDKEATMTRVRMLWSETPAGAKKRILDAARTGSATVYRIFKTGAITPRIALVMASILDADPLYLTGDADENDGYTPDKILEFIRAKGLSEPRGVILDDSVIQAVPAIHAQVQAQANVQTNAQPSVDTPQDGLLSEEAYVLQLRALYNRAAFSESAKEKLGGVTELLFKE